MGTHLIQGDGCCSPQTADVWVLESRTPRVLGVLEGIPASGGGLELCEL